MARSRGAATILCAWPRHARSSGSSRLKKPTSSAFRQGIMHPAIFIVLAQIAIPAPRGYVNDFAGVLDSGSVAHMEAVIAQVRAATRGEIAVVTLPPTMMGDRAASDVAVQIGRQWG